MIQVHPNITLITVLIILFATANNEGGIIILITDSGRYIFLHVPHHLGICVMLDSIFTLSIETEHCLHFAILVSTIQSPKYIYIYMCVYIYIYM